MCIFFAKPLVRIPTTCLVAMAAHIMDIPGALAQNSNCIPSQLPSQTFDVVSVFEIPQSPKPNTQIDKLVFTQLGELGITPANLCSDAVFIRRVYIDLTGKLPSAADVQAFLEDKNPAKRSVLIEKLLATDEFAEFQAMKWSDLLRIKAEYPVNLWPNAAQAYYKWVLNSIKQNKPYDKFVRELLTSSGSNFRVPPVNFYRAVQNRTPRGLAAAVALTFMGTRLDKWPEEKISAMAVFFSQVAYKSTGEWKEEIVYWNKPVTNQILNCTLPDGSTVIIPPDRDPREVFADWLISPTNQWFARNIVNRIWAWLIGRGIVHEPDDIRPDNPPVNPPLLAYLEHELVQSNYDLKHIYRLILNSHVYHLSCIPHDLSPAARENFASYPIRRLDAEVLIDAINQITGTSEKYISPIPEPFTESPENFRAVALPDASITSSFLELFGRPPRDTGLESERNNRITPAQRLHLINSTHINKKIETSYIIRQLSQPNVPLPQAIKILYLNILSRYPTEPELNIAITHLSHLPDKRQGLTDICWALINSAEFLYRH